MKEERVFCFLNKCQPREDSETSCNLPVVKFFAVCPFPCLISFFVQPDPVFLSTSVSFQKYLKTQ